MNPRGASAGAAPKPFSAACERNREPILGVLRSQFADRRRVLEIGSGTGQHAAYFSVALPHLCWQATDRAENLPGIRQWLADVAAANAPGRSPSAPKAMDGREGPPGRSPSAPKAMDGREGPPEALEFDVSRDNAPLSPGRAPVRYDAVFSANTLHIMAWHEVERLFALLPALTTADAKLAIYGPFNVDGKFTSVSNADFDRSLRARAPHMGIRDAAAVDSLARASGFDLVLDAEMPANNRCRVWQRTAG